MRLYEYEAKTIFQKAGIPMPRSKLAKTLQDIRKCIRELGTPVFLKAQILAGGRGKADGIRLVENLDDAE